MHTLNHFYKLLFIHSTLFCIASQQTIFYSIIYPFQDIEQNATNGHVMSEKTDLSGNVNPAYVPSASDGMNGMKHTLYPNINDVSHDVTQL